MRILSVVFFLMGFTCLYGVGFAYAAVTVKVKEFKDHPIEGEGPHLDVRISGDAADDEISVSLEGSLLKINGEDPAGEVVDFSKVVLLHVKGGAGDDSIDLRGLRGFRDLVSEELNTWGQVLVAGHAGDDRIVGPGVSAEDIEATGGRGPDLYVPLKGGRGNDLLIGSRSSDSVAGGRGSDRLYGGDGPDYLQGGPGIDRVWGGDNVWISGRIKRDVIYGGSGNDWLYGGPGDDLILGKEGDDDRIYGGPGVDTMYQDTKSRRGWGPGGVGCEGAPPGLCNPIVN